MTHHRNAPLLFYMGFSMVIVGVIVAVVDHFPLILSVLSRVPIYLYLIVVGFFLAVVSVLIEDGGRNGR